MICVPVAEKKLADALRSVTRANKVADVIEMRLDCLDDASPENVRRLVKSAKKPVVATNRPKRAGGRFQGSEAERIMVLKNAARAGAAYVDIELDTPKKALASLMRARGKSRVIVSHHDFLRTPEFAKLEGILNRMLAIKGAYAFKIVTVCKSHVDLLKITALLRHATHDGKRLIAFCMGKEGRISRTMCLLDGSFMTYAALSKGKETAEGQITVAELRKQLRKLGIPHL